MKLLQVDIDNMCRDPWLIPLQDRLNVLHKAKAQGKKINLLLYHHADTSTFRYRCYNLMQWSSDSTKWQCVYFYHSEIKYVEKLLSKIDILTISRVGWDSLVNLVMDKAKANHVLCAYDLDDCVFDLDVLPILANTIGVDLSVDENCNWWFSYVSRIGFTASKAHIFSATNRYLGNMLEKKYGHPYYVVRNSLNREQLEVSRKCREAKNSKNESISRSEPFVIGYFGGSPTHNNDFKVAASEIAYFLDKHRDAKLYVVGFMDMPQVLREAFSRGQVEVHPLVDFLELQIHMASVHVNIVPLVNNAFTNCKSELKFFEAGIVNTLTVASPVFTYRNIISNGENGYLCDEGQWYDTLDEIYSNWEDQRSVISKACEDSLNFYSGGNIIGEMDQSFDHGLEMLKTQGKCM